MRHWLVLLALLASVKVWAGVPYSMRYVKDHLLYQHEGETNVIDVDLEWPEFVDGTPSVALQQALTQLLFGHTTATLDSAYTPFLQRFGSEVVKPFEAIPDDNRFCYVTCRLRQMGHRQGAYISFRADYLCQPQPHSTQKADTTSVLLTYDLAAGRVLRMTDLLRLSRLSNAYYAEAVLPALLKGTTATLPAEIYAMQVLDACMVDEGMLIDMVCTGDEGPVAFSTLASVEGVKPIVSKVARQLAESASTESAQASFALPTHWAGDTLYNNVEEPPVYNHRGETLMDYLGRTLRLTPAMLSTVPKGHRSVVAFVVDQQGMVRSPRVVGATSPIVDRELARALRLMPAWTPGHHKGSAVNVACMLPVVLKP